MWEPYVNKPKNERKSAICHWDEVYSEYSWCGLCGGAICKYINMWEMWKPCKHPQRIIKCCSNVLRRKISSRKLIWCMRWSYFKRVDMREKSGSSLQTDLKIGFYLHFDSGSFYSVVMHLLKKTCLTFYSFTSQLISLNAVQS